MIDEISQRIHKASNRHHLRLAIGLLIGLALLNTVLQMTWLSRALAIALTLLHFGLFFTVIFRAWRLGAREKTSRTKWHLWVITGASASQVIRHKTVSILREHGPTYGLIALFTIAVALNQSAFPLLPETVNFNFPSDLSGLSLISVTLGCVMVCVLMACQLLFATLLGLCAGSVPSVFRVRWEQLAKMFVIIAVGTGVFLAAAFMVFGYHAMYLAESGINPTLFWSPEFGYWRDMHVVAIVAMFDGGAISWAYPLKAFFHNAVGYFPAFGTPILLIAIYSLWSLIFWVASVMSLRRQGLLAHAE